MTTAADEFLEPIRNHTGADRRIIFHQMAGTPSKKRREAADIVLTVNMTLSR